MRPLHLCLFIFPSILLSCVSTGKFKAEQQAAQKSDSLYTSALNTLKTCREDNNDLSKRNVALKTRADDLNGQLSATNDNNSQLRKQLQDISALSTTQAESIKKSLDNIGAKDTYFQNLHTAITHRDSVNLAVILDLKAYLGGLGDQNISIKTANGAVHVDLADSLLFNSDSNGYMIPDRGKKVLARLARVLNDQPDITCIIEGNPDSTINTQPGLPDNWDLSIKRAASIVRILQNEYNITPARMTAAGHSDYRRTRIVFLPQTDQLEQLLKRR